MWADYLESVLLTVNGWASWCAYLGWQAGLEGGIDLHLPFLAAGVLADLLLDVGREVHGVQDVGDALVEVVRHVFAEGRTEIVPDGHLHLFRHDDLLGDPPRIFR